MTQPAPRAGGFFLILAILIGFVVGMVRGNPVLGSLVGLAVGTLVAIALWWRDRARAGR